MTEATAPAGQPRSRMVGIVYLAYFMITVLSTVFTAPNHAAIGNALNVLSILVYAALTVLLFRLFSPVSRAFSALALLLSLAGCAVSVLQSFHVGTAGISPLLFFGLFCILIGYLILRCTFLPKLLGGLLVVAGIGWLLSLLHLGATLTTPIEVLGFAAEALLMLWLLVAGVPARAGRG